MSQKLSSAAVVIGALRVSFCPICDSTKGSIFFLSILILKTTSILTDGDVQLTLNLQSVV